MGNEQGKMNVVNKEIEPPLIKKHVSELLKWPLNNSLNQTGSKEEEVLKDVESEETEKEEVPSPLAKDNSEPLHEPSDDTTLQTIGSVAEGVSNELKIDEAKEDEIVVSHPTATNIEPILEPSADLQDETRHQSRTSAVSESEVKDRALKKREVVIREIILSEQDYVQHLSLVVNGYMFHMRKPEEKSKMPKDLRDDKDQSLVFGNVEEIYKWHKEVFLPSLEQSAECPVELSALFKRYKRRLYMHVVFYKNYPVSKRIIQKHSNTYFKKLRSKMDQGFQLDDLMMWPVQRFMKYPLLLEAVCKNTEKANLMDEVEALREAIDTLQDLVKTANDMLILGHIHGFHGQLERQGQLLLHGPLVCSESTPSASFKGRELYVFLLEEIIIFSEFEGSGYKYKNHIQMSSMGLEENVWEVKYRGDVKLFCVRHTNPRRTPFVYFCQASTVQERQEWIQNINRLLQMREDAFLKNIEKIS